MLTETLRNGLDQYAIGQKVRALRLKKKMGLVELGQHSGLSPAMLSKIERGRLVPTLPTLLRIALVFSVGLEHFFTEASQRPTVAVVRKRDRQRFPDREGAAQPNYWFECLDYPAVERRMNSYFVQFEDVSDERRLRHQHPGEEVLYVLEGGVTVTIGDTPHELNAGDSLYFDSSVPHSYNRRAGVSATAIVVTTA